jgi:hypothetical protein
MMTACSNAAENGLEKLIENETGEDVQIDLNGEGGISLQTDEGSLQIGEDGSFVVQGQDGQVFTGQASDDGITVEGEDGSAVFQANGDNGGVTFQSEDGSGSVSGGPGMPAEWPAGVPVPEGLTDVNNSVIINDTDMFVSVIGKAPQGAGPYFETYGAAVEASGFNRTTFFESDGARTATYEGNGYEISLFTNNDSNDVSVTVSKQQS